MSRGRRVRRLPMMLLIPALASVLGCAFGKDAPEALLAPTLAVEEKAPLGGEALAQRKQEMRRAYSDLVHFRTTFESLHHRKDRNGLILFTGFVDAYMGQHLAPLLAHEWQSEHPELMGSDANLRLLQAEVLMHMRDPYRVQQVIDETLRRYQGREDILVDYPVGQQSTLAEALELLQRRKWRG